VSQVWPGNARASLFFLRSERRSRVGVAEREGKERGLMSRLGPLTVRCEVRVCRRNIRSSRSPLQLCATTACGKEGRLRGKKEKKEEKNRVGAIEARSAPTNDLDFIDVVERGIL